MKTVDKARLYLENHSTLYWPGVQILKEAVESGFSSQYIRIIEQAESSFSHQKLIDELELFVQKSPAQKIQPENPISAAPKKVYGDFNTSSFPIDLQALHKEVKHLYNHLAQQRGRLIDCFYQKNGEKKSSPNRRAARILSFDIIETDKVIKSIWERLDYYREYGEYMPGTAPVVVDIKKLREWLEVQVQYHNYCVQAEAHKKKTGAYRDQNLYSARKKVLNEIREYLK